MDHRKKGRGVVGLGGEVHGGGRWAGGESRDEVHHDGA